MNARRVIDYAAARAIRAWAERDGIRPDGRVPSWIDFAFCHRDFFLRDLRDGEVTKQAQVRAWLEATLTGNLAAALDARRKYREGGAR